MTSAPEPQFIETDGRRLFSLYHPPQGETRGTVLMLPPFAEEMNMSRRMSYLTGQALAAAGYAALRLDLTGTGDSGGDFVDARWEIWKQDARAALTWLDQKSPTPAGGSANLAILGLRVGALLAADLRQTDKLILWQPVGNGETMLNQFLRIRIAAALTGSGDKETTKDLRALWQSGETVEVAGYEIHPDLAAGIDTLRLTDMTPPDGSKVIWIETGNAERGPAPASQRVIEAWREAGIDVEPNLCEGEPFWTIQETTLAPQMIDATLKALAGA